MDNESSNIDEEYEYAVRLLQQKTTQYFYANIVKLFDELSSELTQGEISEIVINALSINLGTLLAQCSDENRQGAVILSKKLIDSSCLMTIKQISHITYGKIGHA